MNPNLSSHGDLTNQTGHRLSTFQEKKRVDAGPGTMLALNQPMHPHRVSLARESDVPCIYAMQHKCGRDIGFIPRGGLTRNAVLSRIITVHCNGDLAGYCVVTPRIDGLAHILQVAVHPELWRQAYAEAMAKYTIAHARSHGSRGVIAKPAEGLPANEFFEAMMMPVIGTAKGKRRRLVLRARRLNGPPIWPHDFPLRVTPTITTDPSRCTNLRFRSAAGRDVATTGTHIVNLTP